MTILPKKKSSQPKSDRDGAAVDPVQFPPRGLPQNQVRNCDVVFADCNLTIRMLLKMASMEQIW